MFYLCIHEYYNGKTMDVFYALPLGASHRTFAMILIEKTRMVVFLLKFRSVKLFLNVVLT